RKYSKLSKCRWKRSTTRAWWLHVTQPVTSIFIVKGHWQLAAPSDKVQTSIDGENTKVTTTTTGAEVLQFGLIAK
ncbi:hypothetical protein REH76_19375, partial [Photobacterium damselae]